LVYQSNFWSDIMRKLALPLTVIASLVLASHANAAPVIVSFEAPGIQNTTVALTTKAIETFDSFTPGYKEPLSAPFGGGALHGIYDKTFIVAANQYGGAGGAGNYNLVQTTSVLTVAGGTADFFGLWATALDGGNTVSFFKEGINVGSVKLTDYALPDTYKGNPTEPYLGQDPSEIFAFFNIVVPGGFDRVDLVENGGGGFENDNQTIGTVAAAPEPAIWMMMIIGFGMVGTAMRLRGPKLAPA
jgi:hypothetical protein